MCPPETFSPRTKVSLPPSVCVAALTSSVVIGGAESTTDSWRLCTCIETNEHGETRLGVTASRKVGKAVVRHRTKRRVREIFRRFELR